MRETNGLEARTPRRTRRPLVIVAVLAVLVIGGFTGIYLSFFNDDSPERFALSDEPATTVPAAGGAPPAPNRSAAGAGADLAGTWRAVTGSSAGYRVREKLAELPAKSDAVGRSPAVTGTVTVEHAAGTLTASNATFEVDLTKLVSDDNRRDQRIRTDGLQTNRFPKATFTSTRAITLPAGTVSGQAVKATAEGDLTLHGMTRRVTIPLDVRVDDVRAELVGSLGFPMSDFNISPPNVAGFVTVDSDATLEFKLFLEKA